MNKSIEITKIKVNNGQELINKVKEYKNSGGEWKFREKYYLGPASDSQQKEYEWGIKIGNGKQEVDIKSVNNNWVKGKKLNNDDSDGSKFLTNVLDMDEVWNELLQIFPEAAPARQQLDSRGYSLKKIKKEGEDYFLGRYLVAEKFGDLEKIIENYFRENEAKIYNSANRNFSDWVEIIDGQDGNMYLYVGEKSSNGGREIKIGIQKGDFDKEETERLKDNKGNYYGGSELLETSWGLYMMSSNQPLTPTEKENYYKNLEETFQKQWPIREKICRNCWESVANEMEKAFNYWNEKSRQSQYWDHKANEKGILARALSSEIKAELEENKNIKICSDECRHLHDPSLPKKDNPTPTSPKTNGTGKAISSNQLKNSQKSQILSYFLAKNISKISLENNKLVIEYKDNTKKVIESEDRQLQKYHQFIQNLPNQSLSLSDLQKNDSNNSSTPDKGNIELYIGLTIGAFILGGIFVYFLTRKKKNK